MISGGSNRLGNQIVVRVPDNFDLGKFARRQHRFARAKFSAHINAPVNVRRVRLATGDQIIENWELPAFTSFRCGRAAAGGEGEGVESFPVAQKAVFPRRKAGLLKLFFIGAAFDQHFDFAADE